MKEMVRNIQRIKVRKVGGREGGREGGRDRGRERMRQRGNEGGKRKEVRGNRKR